jgi:cytochrome c oxidase subunit II
MRDALGAGLGAAALALAVVALTVGIRDGSGGEGAASGTAARVGGMRTADEAGRAIFVRMGCGSCHTLAAAGSAGSIGPNLDRQLRRHTRASLIARITAAPSAAGSFSAMPTDFGSRMNARELDALVRFLLAAR